jgi:hypothetical protein
VSKKPRNSSIDVVAAAVVQQNIDNMPDAFKASVTPSQVAKAQKVVATKLEQSLQTKTYVARRSVDTYTAGRGAYPEPLHVTRCLRVYATSDGRVKGRSRRGWTTPKAA